jgi:hypothetical protein
MECEQRAGLLDLRTGVFRPGEVFDPAAEAELGLGGQADQCGQQPGDDDAKAFH